jgi:hypothetical protein
MACWQSQLGGTRYWQRCALSELGNGPFGFGRTFSGSAIAAAGTGRIESKVDLSGKLCASESGAEPEENLGSNSPP